MSLPSSFSVLFSNYTIIGPHTFPQTHTLQENVANACVHVFIHASKYTHTNTAMHMQIYMHVYIQTWLNFDMVLNQEPSESGLYHNGNKFPPCSSA